MIGGHRELWIPTGNGTTGFTNITFFDTVYRLDLDTYEWELITITGDKPSPRAYACWTWSDFDNLLYMYGGVLFDNSYAVETIYNDLWSFDPSTNTFALITTTNVGPDGRSTSEMRQKGSKLWITAGLNAVEFGFLPIFTNDIWYLDLDSEELTWVLSEPDISPPARGAFVANVLDHKLYISNGEVFDTDTFEFITLNDTWVFNLNTQEWTDITPDPEDNMDPPRSYTSSSSFGLFDGKWMVYGGEVPGEPPVCFSPFPAHVIGDLWSFNPITRKWNEESPVGDLPPPLKRHACVKTKVPEIHCLSGWDFICDPPGDLTGQVFNNDIYRLRPSIS